MSCYSSCHPCLCPHLMLLRVLGLFQPHPHTVLRAHREMDPRADQRRLPRGMSTEIALPGGRSLWAWTAVPGAHRLLLSTGPPPPTPQEQLPDLNTHFRSQSFHTSMYASSWFLTLFLTTFPLPVATRVFDIFMYEVSTPSPSCSPKGPTLEINSTKEGPGFEEGSGKHCPHCLCRAWRSCSGLASPCCR